MAVFLSAISSSAKMLRHIISFIILLMLNVVCADATDSLPVEAMKAATVRVVCVGSRGLGVGSGLIVGDGSYVVTNAHVVSCVNENGGVGVVKSLEEKYVANLLWKSEEKDLALLSLDTTLIDNTPHFANKGSIRETDIVYALGYPAKADISKESKFHVKFTKGIISTISSFGDGVGIYQIDAAINPGNSGGPLFNDKGQVIGVNFAKGVQTEGIGYAIQIDELLPILEDYGIKYVMYRTSEENHNNNIAGKEELPKPDGESQNIDDYLYSIYKRAEQQKTPLNYRYIKDGRITYVKANENIVDFYEFINENTNYEFVVDSRVYGYYDFKIMEEDISNALEKILRSSGNTIVSSKINTYIIPNDKKTEYKYKIDFENNY